MTGKIKRKRLFMSLIGFGIIGIGVKVYMFSMKSGSFNNPNFLMILSFIIGLIGASLIVYNVRKS